jgi:hypothetical protein
VCVRTPLRRQQHDLHTQPGHHRPAAPALNPHGPPAQIILDLTNPQSLGHRPSLGDQNPRAKPDRGKRDLLGH